MNNLDYYVEMAVNGDRQAFEELYRQTYYVVYYTCFNLLKSEQDAMDVTQDVFVTVMNQLQTLEDKTRFLPWLNRIAVNKCKDFLKKNKPVSIDVENMENTPLEENENFLPEEYAVNQAKRQIVLNIMRSTLSEKEYQTIFLYYFNGLTIPEIADVMECPTGTVTYRLSVARSKIKQGVLAYENKTDDKLYSFAAVPFLASVFVSEINEIYGIGMMPQGMFSSAGAAAGTNVSVYPASADAMPGNVDMISGQTGSSVINNLGKAGMTAMKKKIIGGIVAAVLVCGGATAIILHNINKDKDNSDRTTTEIEDNRTEELDNNDTTEKNTENDTEEYADDVTDEGLTNNTADFEKLADDIIANTDIFFTALKNGDIDTVAKYCTDDSDVLEDILDCNDKAAVSEVMKVVFKDLEWKITQEGREDLASTLEYMDDIGDDSEFVLDVYVINHSEIYLEDFYFASLPEGTAFPEDYTVASEDEARNILETMLNQTPYEFEAGFFIEQVGSDGSFKTDLDDILFFDSLPWDEIDRADTSNVFITFVSDMLDIDFDMVVNSESSVFEEDNDRMKQVEACLLNKNMVEYEQLYNSIRGESIDSTVSYTELSKEQQDKLADIYANEILVYRNALARSENNEKYGSIMLVYPYYYVENIYDEEAAAWLKEKGVTQIDISYDNISDASSMLYVFANKYGRMLDYVSEN